MNSAETNPARKTQQELDELFWSKPLETTESQQPAVEAEAEYTEESLQSEGPVTVKPSSSIVSEASEAQERARRIGDIVKAEKEGSENTPGVTDKNTQQEEFGHGLSQQRRQYVKATEVQEFAEQTWNISQRGVTYPSLVSHFGDSLKNPQEKLKTLRENGMLFTHPFKRFQIQEYYPSSLRADIEPVLKQRHDQELHRNMQQSKDNCTSPFAGLLEEQSAKHFFQILDTASAEGPPLCIHKILLITSIDPEYYHDVQEKPQEGNLDKVHRESVGKYPVTYSICKNGTVKIAIPCSEEPFPMDTPADISNLFAYIGQVRDRLLIRVLNDPRDRIVPPIMSWHLKQYDINRDFPINSALQLTLHNIQLKHAEKVFRLYVKSLQDRAVYRVEQGIDDDITLADVAAGAIWKNSPQFAAFQELKEQMLEELRLVRQELEQLKKREGCS